MRIRSISLQGFKSFGNRTVLELSPRVNVIAGPNGSGKSNIIDGLRWATGGGRASEFRAGEKTELIFHGATGKRSVGYAEVEVELETGEGRVTVTRTLQRDGTGRLRLNGRNARFLDIDEALSGSGLGRGSLAIIGQGEISGVLMADPARLLSFVAEAAGVARLAGRREQAEARLARAKDHMERLQDIHEELQRQLERLADEAEAAERHNELSRESLNLSHTLARARVRSLENDLKELGRQEQQLAQTAAALKEDRDVLQEDLRERRQSLADAQENYREATARYESWRGEVRLRENSLRDIRERLASGRRQEGRLQLELDRLAGLERPVQPTGDRDQLAEHATQAEQQLLALQAERTGLQAKEAEARARLATLQASMRDRELAVSLRQERERNLLQLLADTRNRLAEARTAQDGSGPDPAAELSQVSELLNESRKSLEELRAQLSAQQQRHAHLQADARSLDTNAARLRAAVAARSGFAAGPRLALTAGLPGVIGAVADLLELQAEHRDALAAALGGRSEHIVVETADVARELISFIRHKGAFITVLPLDLVRGRRAQFPAATLKAPGVLGPLIDKVSFDRRFEALFSQLLGSTLLVEDMAHAIRLARAHTERPRLVTLEGELLERGGAMSGGRRQSGASVLGLTAELAQLEEEAEEAEAAAERSEHELRQLQQTVREANAQLHALEDRHGTLTQVAASHREKTAVRTHQLTELSARLGELERDLEQLRAEKLPEEIPEASLRTAEETVRLYSDQLDAMAAKLGTLAAAAQEARGALALHDERQAAHEMQLRRYEQDRQRYAELQQQTAELKAQAGTLEQALTTADEELLELRNSPPVDLKVIASGLEAARQQLSAAERRSDELNGELTGHQEQLDRIRLNLARRETMLESALEEAGRFPPGLPVIEGPERSLRSRLQQVSAELEQLGPVNHRAAAELQQERLRSHQLAADLQDAEAAAAELLESLEQVDAEVTQRSEAAIASVKRSFSEHVSELFGPEAEAAIETIREEGRPAGLGIRLQPPGKRTTQLNLLSVGERTMGALAFLFALMGGTENAGLPIAVLDEVDAPLDEANIQRFTSFVERLAARGTQFLLISHQKTTFSVADAMWGVTSDRGVSSMFSISRSHELSSAGG